MFGNKTKQIKDLRDIQKQSVASSGDDYSVGVYNGIELALACLEGREPEFMCVVKEPEVVEKKEEVGRTKYSGVRKRKAGV